MSIRCHKFLSKLTLTFFLTAQIAGLSFLFPPKLESANLTSVSDTISNNRLSFRGELEGAVAASSGVIALDTTPENANNTSSGSASLMENDSIRVGAGSTATVTTVKTIENATRVILAAGLTNAASDTDPVVSTVSAIHTVSFIPVSTIPNGAFRVLIPAATDTMTGDGLPDKTGFDVITGSLPSVSCTGGGSGYTFETGTATRSAATVSGTNFHSFECLYRGNGGTGTAVIMTIGTPSGSKLINPAPSGYSASHFPGQADTYTFRVRQTEGTAGSYTVADQTLGTLGVVEAVRVTATVAPTLTFHLMPLTTASTACGVSPDVDTTVNSVPLGTIVSTGFTDAAHMLVVSTNASGGYSVTASESAALSLGGLGSTTLPDTTCDAGACTVTTAAEWNTTTSTTNKGFGYALQDINGDCVATALEYNNGATFKARPFGTTAQQIMSSNTVVADDSAYVCYRIIVSGSQQAGDYQNYVIYIATATF